MTKPTAQYTARKPDLEGYIQYTSTENNTWKTLFNRQYQLIENRACDEFQAGLIALNLRGDRIPQIPEMNKRLAETTGWSVEAVDALIPNDVFFALLARKHFPAATFIRTPEELDYLQEPDIFHEFFGHCPLLTNPVYADFTQRYAEATLKASPEDRIYLSRLYWFTIEFGLLNTPKGLRIYGGGILSSKAETIYALESPLPERRPLATGLEALRTPYRIDILQPIYYVIEGMATLFEVMSNDLFGLIHKAQDLGDFTPCFEPYDAPTYEEKTKC